MSVINLKPILRVILASYELRLFGDHGPAHWARVLENGLRLCNETGANTEVVSLFAVLHDSRRVNEGADPNHGQRAADYSLQLRDSVLMVDDEVFERLYAACAGHTHERTHPDVSVQTCWDADRLDLGRVGITPHASRLCTETAKRAEIINWATGRASFRVVPAFVMDEWEIHLPD
jgi:uncharacterized protein